MKSLERFDWTDTLFTEVEKHAVKNIFVDYHGIFDRHGMDIRMNTDVKMKLTPKHDKAVYSQNLAKPSPRNKFNR